MALGANNPRVFAQTVALDAWRSPFDGTRGEADLHIDVVFASGGRAGGGEDAPVRFRLSLKRAEIHVVLDGENILQVNKKSLMRTEIGTSKTSKTSESTTQGAIEGSLDLSRTSVGASANIKAKKSLQITEKMEQTQETGPMIVTHWTTERGYAFKIEPKNANRLIGPPWHAETPVMKVRDTNFEREKGEPPEVRVEIHCLREDLIIEDIQFTSTLFPSWLSMPRKRQIAVEQFLKDELQKHGMDCGDLNDKFARIVLGDVMPSVEP